MELITETKKENDSNEISNKEISPTLAENLENKLMDNGVKITTFDFENSNWELILNENIALFTRNSKFSIDFPIDIQSTWKLTFIFLEDDNKGLGTAIRTITGNNITYELNKWNGDNMVFNKEPLLLGSTNNNIQLRIKTYTIAPESKDFRVFGLSIWKKIYV